MRTIFLLLAATFGTASVSARTVFCKRGQEPQCACTASKAWARLAQYEICQTDWIIEMAHRVYPCWRTFIDVGGNRGYTAMRFFAMWAPSLNATPAAWWHTNVNLGEFVPYIKHGDCGVCRDCLDDLSIYHRHRSTEARCERRESDIVVHSFDGARRLVDRSVRVVKQAFGESLRRRWRYHHAAVSDEAGHAFFEQSTTEFNRLAPFDRKTGANRTLMINRKEVALTEQMVEVVTLDQFMLNGRLQAPVDVLKIDAEGFDLLALKGAERIIAQDVKLLFFEYSEGQKSVQKGFNLARAVDFLSQSKQGLFVCYFTGRRALVRLTNCWEASMDSEHENSWLGGSGTNVFCASSLRARELVAAFDEQCIYPQWQASAINASGFVPKVTKCKCPGPSGGDFAGSVQYPHNNGTDVPRDAWA